MYNPGTYQNKYVPHNVLTDLVVEWVFHGQIMIYTFQVLNEQSIHHWSQLAHDHGSEWPADKPYLVLYDLTKISQHPRFRQHVESIVYNLPTHVEGRCAVVMPNNVHTSILRQFMRGELRARSTFGSRIEREIFASRREALVWLAQRLHNNG